MAGLWAACLHACSFEHVRRVFMACLVALSHDRCAKGRVGGSPLLHLPMVVPAQALVRAVPRFSNFSQFLVVSSVKGVTAAASFSSCRILHSFNSQQHPRTTEEVASIVRSSLPNT